MHSGWLVLSLLATNAYAAEAPAPRLPKAARAVTLVYEIGQADIYYNEMVVEKSTDGSTFYPCAWDEGSFGLQQYDGEGKRSIVFAVWNAANPDNPALSQNAPPVEIVFGHERGRTNKFGSDGKGAQFMRQIPWREGETNRFVVDAIRIHDTTRYSAWFQGAGHTNWEHMATFRGYSRNWMRGYHSSIEDFRRDTNSAQQVRSARFSNTWIHQFGGTYVNVTEAMFAGSRSRFEATDSINALSRPGSFWLATGGDTVKTTKIGDRIKIDFTPYREPDMPRLPFLRLDKPRP